MKKILLGAALAATVLLTGCGTAQHKTTVDKFSGVEITKSGESCVYSDRYKTSIFADITKLCVSGEKRSDGLKLVNYSYESENWLWVEKITAKIKDHDKVYTLAKGKFNRDVGYGGRISEWTRVIVDEDSDLAKMFKMVRSLGGKAEVYYRVSGKNFYVDFTEHMNLEPKK